MYGSHVQNYIHLTLLFKPSADNLPPNGKQGQSSDKSSHIPCSYMGGFVLCSLWIIPQKSTSLHYQFTLNILDEELWVNLQPLTIIIIIINK